MLLIKISGSLSITLGERKPHFKTVKEKNVTVFDCFGRLEEVQSEENLKKTKCDIEEMTL